LIKRLALHIDGWVVLFGAIAVAAFWFAIRLCWSVVRKPWYSVMIRLVVALALVVLGVVMVLYTAFGS
jgi:hypothetical protein